MNVKFVISGFALLALPAVVLTQNSCVTQSGSDGYCVPGKDCQTVVDATKKYGSFLPVSIKRKLMQNGCKPEARTFHICCANDKLTTRRGGQSPGSSRQSNNPFLRGKQTLVEGSKHESQSGMQLLQAQASVCGNKLSKKLSGGEETNIGEFPWMALLKYNSARQFLCGGSLITDRHILTAAHCMLQTNPIGVRLGEHNLDTEKDCQNAGRRLNCLPPYEDYDIESTKIHEGYVHGVIKNDVGIVKLKRSVQFKHHIQPICLPIDDKSQRLNANEPFIIAGWGNTYRRTMSSVLRKAVIRRQDDSVCRPYYRDDSAIRSNICAVGSNITHTCAGDSGGPLFALKSFMQTARYVQYGVVSYGSQTCGINIDQPGTFANVLEYLPWITKNLQ